MEKPKQVGASSSSFTVDLFGPKDSSKSSSSSAGLFGSVFGPSSTGLRKDSSHSGASRNQDSGTQYANQRNRGESNGIVNKDRGPNYQSEAAEPCYFSSSIYYGGQEVYSPNSHTTNPQHMTQNQSRKDGEDDDPNGNNSSCASRGNWWQGSLYY